MLSNLEKEYKTFTVYHKNTYNVLFHIFSSLMFMSIMFKLLGKYQNIGLVSYLLLLLLTIKNLNIIILIFVLVYIIINHVLIHKLSNKYYLILFIIFYYLPELSHILFGESNKDVIKRFLENPTEFPVFINIFYLLPFSLKFFN